MLYITAKEFKDLILKDPTKQYIFSERHPEDIYDLHITFGNPQYPYFGAIIFDTEKWGTLPDLKKVHMGALNGYGCPFTTTDFNLLEYNDNDMFSIIENINDILSLDFRLNDSWEKPW